MLKSGAEPGGEPVNRETGGVERPGGPQGLGLPLLIPFPALFEPGTVLVDSVGKAFAELLEDFLARRRPPGA